jgi:hypothetical protein
LLPSGLETVVVFGNPVGADSTTVVVVPATTVVDVFVPSAAVTTVVF